MKVNYNRLKNRIDTIAEASKDPTGGYTRLAFSAEDIKTRETVMEMMREAGLTVSRDAAGNLLGKLDPKGLGKGYIATGSHIDTVRNGGKFDGLLGSMAAIEAVHTMTENNIELSSPIEVVIFSDEEGARFNCGMLGSKSICGEPLDADIDTFADRDGVKLTEALKDMGIDPYKIQEAKAPEGKYKSFVELHIEQSIVLENNGNTIGIVDGIKGPYWVKGYFEGESNHAGGTPMNLRKDALVAASHFVTEVYRIAQEVGGVFVATVGTMNVKPGGINTISSLAEFTIDIRDIDEKRRAEGISLIEKAAEESAKLYGVKSQLTRIKDSKPEKMSKSVMDAIEGVCKSRNLPYETLTSGPFHDALTMTAITDVGMIFVPSINGVSHSPFEDTKWEDIYVGADVLLETIISLAQ